MRVIEVRRPGAGWRDRYRSYKLLVDEVEVGRIKRGDTARLEVDPGDHVIQVGIDWKLSAEVVVDGDGPGVIRLVCGPSGYAFTDAFRRGDDAWLFLRQEDDD